MVIEEDSTVPAFTVVLQFAFLHVVSTAKLQGRGVIAQPTAALVKVVMAEIVLLFAPERQLVNNLQGCQYEAEITFP